jgi:hypothetical protein
LTGAIRVHHKELVRQGAEHAVTVDQQPAAMTLDIVTELVHCVPPFQQRRRIGVDPYL